MIRRKRNNFPLQRYVIKFLQAENMSLKGWSHKAVFNTLNSLQLD